MPLSKPLPGQVTVDLTVSEQALAAVVRRTGDAHGGIQVRCCSIELVDGRQPGGRGERGRGRHLVEDVHDA